MEVLALVWLCRCTFKRDLNWLYEWTRAQEWASSAQSVAYNTSNSVIMFHCVHVGSRLGPMDGMRIYFLFSAYIMNIASECEIKHEKVEVAPINISIWTTFLTSFSPLHRFYGLQLFRFSLAAFISASSCFSKKKPKKNPVNTVHYLLTIKQQTVNEQLGNIAEYFAAKAGETLPLRSWKRTKQR